MTSASLAPGDVCSNGTRSCSNDVLSLLRIIRSFMSSRVFAFRTLRARITFHFDWGVDGITGRFGTNPSIVEYNPIAFRVAAFVIDPTNCLKSWNDLWFWYNEIRAGRIAMTSMTAMLCDSGSHWMCSANKLVRTQAAYASITFIWYDFSITDIAFGCIVRVKCNLIVLSSICIAFCKA